MVLLCVQGGGLFIYGGTVTMTSCSVYSNTASGVSARLLNLTLTFHGPVELTRPFASRHLYSIFRAKYVLAPNTPLCPFHRPVELTHPFASRHVYSIFRAQYVLAPNTPRCHFHRPIELTPLVVSRYLSSIFRTEYVLAF